MCLTETDRFTNSWRVLKVFHSRFYDSMLERWYLSRIRVKDWGGVRRYLCCLFIITASNFSSSIFHIKLIWAIDQFFVLDVWGAVTDLIGEFEWNLIATARLDGLVWCSGQGIIWISIAGITQNLTLAADDLGVKTGTYSEFDCGNLADP